MQKIYWQIQQMNRIGGAEMVSIDLANHLSKYYDITLLSTVNNEGDVPYFIDPAVKVESLGVPKRVERLDVLTKKYLKHFRLISLLGLYIQLAFHYGIKLPFYRHRLTKKLLGEDAILICSAADSYYMAPRKGKVYFHFHFDSPIFFRGDNYPIFKICRKPDKWIFITKAAMDGVCERLPKLREKSYFVHNPVRFERTLDLTYRNNTILFAGRFNTQKNPLLALEVAKELKSRGLPFKLRMFGDPIMERQMDAYIAENDLGDVVELHDPTNDIKTEMLDSDLLLLTSEHEGFCLSLAEANALSRPWVSTYWGKALDELYEDGKAGFVIRDNKASSMADKIMELLSNKEKLLEAKRNAYEASSRFEHEAIVEKWREILG